MMTLYLSSMGNAALAEHSQSAGLLAKGELHNLTLSIVFVRTLSHSPLEKFWKLNLRSITGYAIYSRLQHWLKW